MYVLYAPYNDKWFLLTADDPRTKSNNLYHWDTNMKTIFESVDDISEKILYFDINCEGLIVVPVKEGFWKKVFPEYIPDFTESFEYHWSMAREYQQGS